MKLNDYQKMALETAVYPKEYKTIYPALGMNGEAGGGGAQKGKSLGGVPPLFYLFLSLKRRQIKNKQKKG